MDESDARNATENTGVTVECIRLMNQKINELQGQVDNIAEDVKDCQSNNDKLFKSVADLEKRQRKNESWSKKFNVIVTNLITLQDLKDMSRDDLKARIVEFVNTTVLARSSPRIQIPPEDFLTVHKLSDDRGPYMPIIIQFNKEDHVTALLENAKDGIGHINEERKRKAAQDAQNGGNGNPRCISIRQQKDEITTKMYSYLSWAKREIERKHKNVRCMVKHEGKRQDPVLYYKNLKYTVYTLPPEIKDILPVEYSHQFTVPKNNANHPRDRSRSRVSEQRGSNSGTRSSSRLSKNRNNTNRGRH